MREIFFVLPCRRKSIKERTTTEFLRYFNLFSNKSKQETALFLLKS